MVRTIKYIQMLLIVSGILLTASSQAKTGERSEYDSQAIRTFGGGGGGDFPWPWGLEVSFPWDDIQGVWKVENKGKIYYFGFRRVQDKRIFVTQFDASRCLTLGSGPGFIRNKAQNFVVSQITLKATGDAYRMAIYAFDEQDSPEPPAAADGEATVPEHVMVARITSMSTQEREIAVQMVRISDRLEFKCVGQDKKLRF
jgi:hypothetical protein